MTRALIHGRNLTSNYQEKIMSVRLLLSAVVTGLLALGSSSAVYAAAHEGATEGCGDIAFVAEITDVFPEASNACVAIVSKDGAEYARFDAEIVRVRGAEVRAKFKKPNGDWTDTYAFRPDPDRRVKIQGRSYRYRDLARGQQLNIYLATTKFEMVVPDDDSDFLTTVAVTTVPMYAPEPEPAMPTTASPVPLFALLGGVFVFIGAGFRLLRKRLAR